MISITITVTLMIKKVLVSVGHPNHAVCITGVDLDKDNNVLGWKFKNSIVDKVNKGYNVVSKE